MHREIGPSRRVRKNLKGETPSPGRRLILIRIDSETDSPMRECLLNHDGLPDFPIGALSQLPPWPGVDRWTIPVGSVCNRGRDPLIGLDGASPHAHDPATCRQCFRGSSAVNMATSPRWPRTVSNHGSRCTARPNRSPRPWTAPRPRPVSTSFSGNSAEQQAEVQALQERLEARGRDHS